MSDHTIERIPANARAAMLAVVVAVVGFCVPVFLGPALVRQFDPDPHEWEPSDAEMRQALDGLPFDVRYRATDVDGGLRWFRGRAVRRGVTVRFAFLVGSGAATRVSPPGNFRLLAGCSDTCLEGLSFRVVYASDADMLSGDTRSERRMRNAAFDTSFAIVDAVNEKRD